MDTNLFWNVLGFANRDFKKMIDKATSRSALQSLNSILHLQANTVFWQKTVGAPNPYLEEMCLCKSKLASELQSLSKRRNLGVAILLNL